jgi:hypothetical protein
MSSGGSVNELTNKIKGLQAVTVLGAGTWPLSAQGREKA